MVRIYNQRLAGILMMHGYELISVDYNINSDGYKTYTFDTNVKDIRQELNDFYGKKE